MRSEGESTYPSPLRLVSCVVVVVGGGGGGVVGVGGGVGVGVVVISYLVHACQV